MVVGLSKQSVNSEFKESVLAEWGIGERQIRSAEVSH